MAPPPRTLPTSHHHTAPCDGPQPSCVKEPLLSSGATGDVEGSWTRYYFPASAFECKDMGGGWGVST